MHVCLFGTFDLKTARARQVLRLLGPSGCSLSFCHVPVWDGIRRTELFRRRNDAWRVAFRILLGLPALILRALRTPRPGLVLVGYPGHWDLPLGRLLGRLWRAPVVFDPFISLYDTVVSDREMAPARSVAGQLARWLDRLACRLSDRVLADTPEHAAYLAELCSLPMERFRVLREGAEEAVFCPHPEIEPEERRVLFYGTFVPLQGVPVIVRAAKLLEPDRIQVRIIGEGQESPAVEGLVKELSPSNVELIPWVDYEKLPSEIARAGLCLGIFGTSGKAGRVVPNKLFQCVAVGRPVLTAETPAIRSAFIPGREVATCPAGDPAALADAIRDLMDDPARREAIARAGRARFVRDYSEEALSTLLRRHLEELLKGRAGSP